MLNNQLFHVVALDGSFLLSVTQFKHFGKGPSFFLNISVEPLSQVLVCLLEVEVGSEKALENFAGLKGHPISDWLSADEFFSKLFVCRDNHPTELAKVDMVVVILIVFIEEKEHLVPVVQAISYVAE